MSKKAYATPSTVEHGGAMKMTLGAGWVNNEGGTLLDVE